jgi:hypothetical protein
MQEEEEEEEEEERDPYAVLSVVNVNVHLQQGNGGCAGWAVGCFAV